MFMMAFKLTDAQKVHNVYRSLKAQIKAHYRSIFFVTDFCQDLCKVSKILESEGLKEKIKICFCFKFIRIRTHK